MTADKQAFARSLWRYIGQERPPFAAEPAPGQESVWDYPRPPRLQIDPREVIVRLGQTDIARSTRAIRVLETASPPTFYLPREDVRIERLQPSPGSSMCEWKGQARYWSVVVDDRKLEGAAWVYPDPLPDFEAIRGYFAFYPTQLECFVGGVRALPQPGRFYAGWVTPELTGPFKGEPGSQGW
ncbi:DUF427 domain-containing protein [soil metagenome]